MAFKTGPNVTKRSAIFTCSAILRVKKHAKAAVEVNYIMFAF